MKRTLSLLCLVVVLAIFFIATASAKEPLSLGFDGNQIQAKDNNCGCEADEISLQPITDDSQSLNSPPGAPDWYTSIYVPNCWDVAGVSRTGWIIQFLECRELTRGDPYWD